MALREAEANGSRGDRTAMINAISRAFKAYESTRGFDPDWIYLPEAEMSGVSGKAYMRLGNHAAATAHLRDAIGSSVSWPRERASWQLHLAHNLIRSGDTAQACTVLSDTCVAISDLASPRLQGRLNEPAAARPHASVAEAREFLRMWVERRAT